MEIFRINRFGCKLNLKTGCLIISGIDFISNSMWMCLTFYYNFYWHKGRFDLMNVLMILSIFQVILSVVLIVGIKKRKILYLDCWIFNLFTHLAIEICEFGMHLYYYLFYVHHGSDLAIELINCIPTVIVSCLVPFVWKLRKTYSNVNNSEEIPI